MVPAIGKPRVSGRCGHESIPWTTESGEARSHVRPPSREISATRTFRIQRSSATAAMLRTYWLTIRPHTESFAVVAPIESVITRHVCPSSHVSLIPSAVAMYVVSPRVRIPFGVTYCHSGPSWPNSQFFHVLPPSVDSPQPFPTVPYQICPCGPKPNACTKSHEMACAAVSTDERIRSHSPRPTPFRSTKIPCPYVPTQMALLGARAIAST